MTLSNLKSGQAENIIPEKPRLTLGRFFRFGVWAILGTAFVLLLFLWLINRPSFYDPKETFVKYTGLRLAPSSIDRFSVRNFFYLDGPDFSYELNLSPQDKASLVNVFVERSSGNTSTVGAAEQIPFDWMGGSQPKLKRYFYSDNTTSPGAGVFLDVDTETNKAWLVIETY